MVYSRTFKKRRKIKGGVASLYNELNDKIKNRVFFGEKMKALPQDMSHTLKTVSIQELHNAVEKYISAIPVDASFDNVRTILQDALKRSKLFLKSSGFQSDSIQESKNILQ